MSCLCILDINCLSDAWVAHLFPIVHTVLSLCWWLLCSVCCPLACLFWIVPVLSVWIHSSADRSHASALAACVFRVSFREFHVQVLGVSLWFLYKCVRYGSSFILSLLFIQWSQFYLLQTLSFLHWVFLAPLSDLSRVIMFRLIPRFPILFHWSIFLFLHQYHKLLMAIDL